MSDQNNENASAGIGDQPRGELSSLADANARAEAKQRANTPGPTELVQTRVRASTGQPRGNAQPEVKMVRVDYLKRDYTFGPPGNQKVYGPGEDIEIPADLAAALGFSEVRTAVHHTTRAEEKEFGVDKAEKHPTATDADEGRAFNAIPVSDPTREGASVEERVAADEARGTTQEQHIEKVQQDREAALPPRERAASRPKAEK